jgi:hypothetical protein
MKNLLRAIFAVTMATLLVASSTMPSDAARRHARYAATRTYDGLWSVSIITLYGDCSRGYRYPARIVYGRVVKADSDPNYQIYGAVARNGAIRVTVSGGGQSASGYGRLSRNYGRGRWRTSTGECSGEWTAVRRGY